MENDRKDALVTNEIYHIFNKSIADYKIFNTSNDFLRIKQNLLYYQSPKDTSFSVFIRSNEIEHSQKNISVKIIAYCIMPTHFHLILKQLDNGGISKYINNISNSYSRYFNIKHNRKGPLWQGRFKNVLVKDDEQLLHLTRYIHLNPVTSNLIDKPETWEYSSYREYLNLEKNKLCDFSEVLSIDPKDYKKFVNDRINYQRELAKVSHLILE
ncbi:MAG: transposase [Elusimicrobia bacterium]|nr:transposase [Elusimicrobiota bacterium]